MQSYPNPNAPTATAATTTTPHKRARDSPESRSPESPTHPVNKASRTTFSPRALFDGFTPTPAPKSTTTTTPRLPSTSASFGFSSASLLASENSPNSGTLSPTARPRTLLCTLPPTCSRRPTSLASSKDLEAHYATHHAHVCEVRACAAVFPDARLLELHQTECHDPIAAVRKDRGEKIFACHLPAPTCGRTFPTPKARRLHLISTHAYPKAYFFAVTNKGIGGLLSKWGDGASMIRGEWKAREGDKVDANGKNTTEGTGEKMDVDVSLRRGDDQEDDEDDSDEEEDEDEDEDDDEEDEEDEDEDEMNEDLNRTPRVQAKEHLHPHAYDGRFAPHDDREDADANELAQDMDALALVPSSIRFGRGGKSGGLMNRGGGFGFGGGHGGGGGIKNDTEVNKNDPNATMQVRGRGVRGRGFPRDGHGAVAQTQEISTNAGQVFRGRGRGRGDLGWAGGRGRAGIVHIPRGRGRGAPRATSVAVRGRGT